MRFLVSFSHLNGFGQTIMEHRDGLLTEADLQQLQEKIRDLTNSHQAVRRHRSEDIAIIAWTRMADNG